MKDYYWLNEKSRTYLERGYLSPGETAEERIKIIADTAEKELGIEGFSGKFQGYMAKGFYSLSSPIWANYGTERGYPISCNGCVIEDSMESILYKAAETGILTKHGAGTSGFFGKLRPRGAPISKGGTSSGPIHFAQIYETVANVVSQSNVRRGSFALYLNVDHPDFLEALDIREEGNPIQNLSLGVCIPDDWMESMKGGDKEKRKIWGKIIKKRFSSGYPYIFFSDTVNKNAPEIYKEKEKTIYASNLCSEIALAASEDETFVCNLSSINVVHWEAIKETDAVETLFFFLDAVMSEYIRKVKDKPFLEHAYNFASRQRAIGLGVLGLHSFYQSRMIAFESMEAKFLNIEIFKTIKEKTRKANQELARLFGEPELLKGKGLRCVTEMAIAPTTSSSFILGQVSPSIEPLNSNYFVKDLAKLKATYKNPYLKILLRKYEKDDEETWKSILLKGGSVQHLSFLTVEEKDVFKTFGEISQKEIVIQNIQRQKYVDQAISLNLMIPPGCPAKDVSDLLIYGWENGIKTFYYQRSASPTQNLARSILSCSSCES